MAGRTSRRGHVDSGGPVPRPATLEFVAGSHLGPWLMPRTFMDNQAQWFPEGSLQDLPDIEADRSAHRILGWDITPGDVVCFHMLTLHGAGGFEGPGRRRVFSVRFLGDDTRHAPRRWTTSPDFPGLADTLPAGAPMDHPLFPLLVGDPWQQHFDLGQVPASPGRTAAAPRANSPAGRRARTWTISTGA